MSAPVVIERPDGRILVEETREGRRRVTVALAGGEQACETRYSPALIEATLELAGPESLCYLLQRHEHAAEVRTLLGHVVPAYLDAEALRGRRVLDVHTGSGAWAVVLAELLPWSTIVSVDFREPELAAARLRVAEHGLADRIELHRQPSPTALPDGIGPVSAVVLIRILTLLDEPDRADLLRRCWAALEPGGRLVVAQAAHRWFPVEGHVTGLPLVNYLPNRLALTAARRLSRTIADDVTWRELVHAGIRGTTARRVARPLAAAGGRPVPVRPALPGCRDAVDVWHAYSTARRAHPAKTAIRLACRVVSTATRAPFAPDLNLAFEKR